MSVYNIYKRAEGAYAIPRSDNKTIVIKVPKEDIGKIEGISIKSELSPIISGMFGIVSGKIDESDESPAAALSRELFDEQGIAKPVEAFTNGLPMAEIIQERPEGKFLFTVHGHKFDIAAEEITDLQNRTTAFEISDDQLKQFLLEQHTILRPSVHAILTLFLQYMEKEGRHDTT